MRVQRILLGISLLAGLAQGLPTRTFTLENGLQVILIQNKIAPLVTIVTAFRAGGTYETPVSNGVFHLYEHMLFKGNKTYPDQLSYMRRLRELGIVFNGSTSTERVEYHYTLPSSLLKEGLEFMRDAILYPLFDEKELEKEKPVVLDEYHRDFSNPYYTFSHAVSRAFYGKYYYRKNVIGDTAAIRGATRDLLLQIQRDFYNPENCILIVAGDLEFDKAEKAIRELWSVWKKSGQRPALQPVPHTQKTQEVVLHLPVQTTRIQYLFAGPNVGQQTEDTYVGDLLGTLMNMPGSRFLSVFVDSGLASQASFGYYTQRYGGELSFSFETTPEKVDQVKRRLARFIEEMSQPGFFKEEDLKKAKQAMEIDYYKEQESASDYAISLSFWVTVADWDYYRTYLEHVRAVTLEDLQRFVKKYLLDQPHVIGVLLPEEVEG